MSTHTGDNLYSSRRKAAATLPSVGILGGNSAWSAPVIPRALPESTGNGATEYSFRRPCRNPGTGSELFERGQYPDALARAHATYSVGVDAGAKAATSSLLHALSVRFFLDSEGRVVPVAFGAQTVKSLSHGATILASKIDQS